MIIDFMDGHKVTYENILGENCGVLSLVDMMPRISYGIVNNPEDAIVQAARTSFGKDQRKIGDKDRISLISYMMEHGHTSPFEQIELKFYVELPISVARQWVRHRTASINEYSTRYAKAINQTYLPLEIHDQGNSHNKQKSSLKIHELSEYYINSIDNIYNKTRELYEDMINHGVAKEEARGILPLNTMTRWYWKANLHNTLRFIKLRMSDDAQPDIFKYAYCMEEILEDIFPITMNCFK